MHRDKKTSVSGAWGDTATGVDNTLYTAQKVHTLAQIVFQRLAERWTSRAPWTGPTGFVAPQPYVVLPGHGVTQATSSRPDPGGSGVAQGGSPPALFYWYP